MKRIGLIGWLLLGAAIGAMAQPSPEALQRTLDELAGREPLKGAAWGACIQKMDGTVIAARQGGMRLTPASNLKLITTGSALHAFGADYRFETRVGYTGRIEEGTLKGDVYLIGGGDPTIGVKDSIALKPDALFWKWKSQLKGAGIQRVEGRILGDGRAWEGGKENTSWTYDDIGTYYGAGSDALSFYENAVDFYVSATEEGKPVRIQQIYPETPWMTIENQTMTGPAGTGNSLFLFTTDLSKSGAWRGSFAVGRKPKTEHAANKYGALTCAYYFWKYLKNTGFEVSGGYGVPDTDEAPSRPGNERAATGGPLTLVGKTLSPPLSDIVRFTNWRSDNFYAESLFRLMGEKASGIAVYDSCRVAEAEVLKSLGLDPSSVRLEDGSGLSRRSAVSPAFFCDFLRAMQGSPAADAFLGSLPALGEGTLRTLLPNHPSCSRIRLKSGSMEGILCYSGYLLDESGVPVAVFSLMTGGTTAPTGEVRSALARILTLLLE